MIRESTTPNILWLEWDGFYTIDSGDRPLAIVRNRIVLDSNRAARRKSVFQGMTVRQVRTLAQDCELKDWSEDEYEERQRQWLDICAEFTGIIEPIDQHIAALDLSAHPNRLDITEALIRRLATHLNIPLKYGSSTSTWIARLAAEREDAGLAHEDPKSFLASIPVRRFLPIPQEHRERLMFLGYRTIGQVAQIPLPVLKQQFGDLGHTISQAARGGYTEPVRPLYPPNSLRECILFESPIEDLEVMQETLKVLAQRIAVRLEGRQSSNMELIVEMEDSTIHINERSFTKPIYSFVSALAALRLLFPDLTAPEEETEARCGFAALRVTLTEIEPIRQRQHLLIEAKTRPAVKSAVHYIQNTFGEGAIKLASQVEVPRRERVLREWRHATGWN